MRLCKVSSRSSGQIRISFGSSWWRWWSDCLGFSDGALWMRNHRANWLSGVTLAAAVGIAAPSYATTGTVRVTVAKAGFVLGAGGGRGVLTFKHRNYPFTVQGLSLGLTAGASINKLVGRAEDINDPSDFSGTYSALGAGMALAGGVGGVQLRNAKGVTITLQGFKGGVEAAANITKVVITLDQSRSTPD